MPKVFIGCIQYRVHAVRGQTHACIVFNALFCFQIMQEKAGNSESKRKVKGKKSSLLFNSIFQ